MIARIRRESSVYLAIASMLPKVFLAYQMWFWAGLVLYAISMTILVYFWRGVYASTNEIAGLALHQTLTYLLLAQVFAPLTDLDVIWDFGYNIREGVIIHQLLRPVSFQGMYYAQNIASLITRLIMQAPVLLVAIFVFGLQLPGDPLAWGAFAISALLGFSILFFFHWCLACMTFYTTEVWGFGVLIFGMTLFLSGGLVPLAMMPDWLRNIVLAIPFAQALAVPISILTGITPLRDVLSVWLIQIAWLIGLFIISNLIFRIAVRKITIQGG